MNECIYCSEFRVNMSTTSRAFPTPESVVPEVLSTHPNHGDRAERLDGLMDGVCAQLEVSFGARAPPQFWRNVFKSVCV